jgi:hypothetical protein
LEQKIVLQEKKDSLKEKVHVPKNQEINFGQTNFDIKTIQKGYYLIKIEGNDGVLISKFQKN